MSEPVVLTGNTPLWHEFKPYVEFIRAHEDEIWERAAEGNDLAEFIVELLVVGVDSPERRAVLKVIVERFINDFHPDIAVIEGGYPRDLDSRLT